MTKSQWFMLPASSIKCLQSDFKFCLHLPVDRGSFRCKVLQVFIGKECRWRNFAIVVLSPRCRLPTNLILNLGDQTKMARLFNLTPPSSLFRSRLLMCSHPTVFGLLTFDLFRRTEANRWRVLPRSPVSLRLS